MRPRLSVYPGLDLLSPIEARSTGDGFRGANVFVAARRRDERSEDRVLESADGGESAPDEQAGLLKGRYGAIAWGQRRTPAVTA
jgi:hypothetical protein